jgi:hypothetical protein
MKRSLAHTITEAQAVSKIGRDGIYEAIREGRLVARKYGRRTLILDEDLRMFLASLPRLDLAIDGSRVGRQRRPGCLAA